jgi:hypothetical protein
MGTRVVYEWDADGRIVSEQRVTLRTVLARLTSRISGAESN